ncbi:MAG: hypothetical protein ACI38Q_05880 [Candidatus Bruticola sp.]
MNQYKAQNPLDRQILREAIYKQAYAASGEAGLSCLKVQKMEPTMQNFFASLILNYLNRELPELNWQIKVRNNFFSLSWIVKGQRKEWLQLRFAPRFSRWMIVRRGGLKVRANLNGNLWFPHEPDRQCLSLSDWLGQIRKLLTNRFVAPSSAVQV